MYGNYTKLLRRQNDHMARSFFVRASEVAKVNEAEEIILPSIGS
jgi:hypothetical protein